MLSERIELGEADGAIVNALPFAGAEAIFATTVFVLPFGLV